MMWAFVDVGFAGGVVMIIITSIWVISDCCANNSRISHRDKARIDRRCDEEIQKTEKRMEEFAKERPNLFTNE